MKRLCDAAVMVLNSKGGAAVATALTIKTIDWVAKTNWGDKPWDGSNLQSAFACQRIAKTQMRCTRPCGCTGSAAPSHFWWCCFPSCLWSEMCHLHHLATWACQNAHQFLHRPIQVAALHLGSKQRGNSWGILGGILGGILEQILVKILGWNSWMEFFVEFSMEFWMEFLVQLLGGILGRSLVGILNGVLGWILGWNSWFDSWVEFQVGIPGWYSWVEFLGWFLARIRRFRRWNS